MAPVANLKLLQGKLHHPNPIDPTSDSPTPARGSTTNINNAASLVELSTGSIVGIVFTSVCVAIALIITAIKCTRANRGIVKGRSYDMPRIPTKAEMLERRGYQVDGDEKQVHNGFGTDPKDRAEVVGVDDNGMPLRPVGEGGMPRVGGGLVGDLAGRVESGRSGKERPKQRDIDPLNANAQAEREIRRISNRRN
ncbi:hypothetical protein EJ08DRAFT_730867 [Tothia fuscella]|uniref:Uncharacterized protein n=1 Tax=Tothia fuscella TaxID=1048955 RepID=A0A9P4NZL8_9PEZI|nr:hypothetical protein EJ08DRAFT_730867 [Tothia fuscella]